MSTAKHMLVYVTFSTKEDALRIGRTVVEERLAACANLRGSGTSIYEWENTVEVAEEWILLLKTSTRRLDALQARIVELHPYTTPCVLAWGIDQGHAPFLAWIDDMTTDA